VKIAASRQLAVKINVTKLPRKSRLAPIFMTIGLPYTVNTDFSWHFSSRRCRRSKSADNAISLAFITPIGRDIRAETDVKMTLVNVSPQISAMSARVMGLVRCGWQEAAGGWRGVKITFCRHSLCTHKPQFKPQKTISHNQPQKSKIKPQFVLSHP